MHNVKIFHIAMSCQTGRTKKKSIVLDNLKETNSLNDRAQIAHSNEMIPSDFVIEGASTYAQNAGGQFLIAAHVRECQADEFLLHLVQ